MKIKLPASRARLLGAGIELRPGSSVCHTIIFDTPGCFIYEDVFVVAILNSRCADRVVAGILNYQELIAVQMGNNR